jgi:membrane-associated phospholipid phosphatase
MTVSPTGSADVTDTADVTETADVTASTAPDLDWRRRWWHRLRGRNADGTPRARPYPIGELIVVAILLRVYDWVKELISNEESVARTHGSEVVRLEKDLGLFIEPDLNRWITAHHWLSVTSSYYYQFEFYTVAFVILGFCWWSWPHYYRWARNALVLTNVVGLAVFVAYPTMPPRLLDVHLFRDSVSAAGFGSNHGGPIPAAQFAAMPSLHVAWALWCAIVLTLVLRRWWTRLLAWIYPGLTTFAVMATANHYLMDAVAGAATIGLCALLSSCFGSGRGALRLNRAAILAGPDPGQPAQGASDADRHA